MIRHFAIIGAAAVSVILSACALSADVQPTDQVNSYLVPLTLVDHPQCNGAGQTAFSLALQAEDIRFRLRADGWTTTFDLGGHGWSASEDIYSCFLTEGRGADRVRIEINCDEQMAALPRVCTIEERRGTERVQVQMPCPATAEQATDAATPQILQMDLSMRLTTCQSVMRLEIIEGDWVAELTVDDTVTREQGVVYMSGQRRSVPRDQPDAQMTMHVGTGVASSFGGEHPPHIRLIIRQIPVNLPEVGGRPALVQTGVNIIPTLDGSPLCKSADCNLSLMWNMFSW